MATIVRLPKLGLSDRGEIVEWRVDPGDEVAEDDVIAVLESDKSAVDIVATADGVVLSRYVEEGEEVEIEPGRPIAAIGAPGESPPTPAEAESGAAAADDPETETGSAATATPDSGTASPDRKVTPRARKTAAEADVSVDLSAVEGTGPEGAVTSDDVEAAIESGGAGPATASASASESADAGAGGDADATPATPATEDVRATPKAKRLARSEGVDLSTVEGTGPQGAVTASDVRGDGEAGGAGTPAPATASTDSGEYEAAEVRELTRTERTVAERLTRSAREKPHVRGDRTVTVERLEAVSEELGRGGRNVSVNDLLFRAVVMALEDHPEVNAVYEDDRYKLVDSVDVGYAVDTDAGLLVPVVEDAAEKSLGELATARRDVVSRVLDGEHSPSDLRGGTFTVTNVGALGLDSAFSIINPPQVAILVVGRRKPALFETDDGIETAMGVTLSLLVDHRVLDGGDAGAFLTTLAEYVENPSLLL